jgi:hypothetical protein
MIKIKSGLGRCETKRQYVNARPHPGPMASQARHQLVAPYIETASRYVVPRGEGETWSVAGEIVALHWAGTASGGDDYGDES